MDRHRREYDIQDGIIVEVLDKIVTRHHRGMKEYGVSMEDNKLPTTAWIDHTIEELLDAVNYLTRLKRGLNEERIKEESTKSKDSKDSLQ